MRRCFDYRTIRQLMLFAAVTQEKSFRRAAKRLNMSVPPLVLQIDELEARLRMKLLGENASRRFSDGTRQRTHADD